MPLLHLLLSCYLYLATSRARLFQLHVPSAPTLWRTWLVARIRGQGTWTAELKMPILLPNATLIGGNRVVDVTLSFSVAHNYSCVTFDKTKSCTKTIDASSVLMAGSSIFGSTGGPPPVHLLLQHRYSTRLRPNPEPLYSEAPLWHATPVHFEHGSIPSPEQRTSTAAPTPESV